MSNAADLIAKLKELDQKYSIKTEHGAFPRPKRQETLKGIELTKNILWKLFRKHQPKSYVLDDRNKEIVYTVLRYFLRDPDFNEYNLIKNEPSLDKGLLIFGDFGVGKSELFKILRNCGKDLLKKGCKDLWFPQISTGSFVEEYMQSTKSFTSNFDLKKNYTGKLYIDDLGMEKKAFNRDDIIADLLFERNRKKSITFATTNLKPSELSDKYGQRIGDRLPEMFNIISWSGTSFRK